MTPEERFWQNVAVGANEACWPWRLSKNNWGYGQVGYGVGGQRIKTVAHRRAWEFRFGPIPDGLCVLHHCDNPPCCNPTHLFLGTHAANAADRAAKGRTRNGSQTHPERHPFGARNGSHTQPHRVVRGSAVHGARLTEDQVRRIRRLRANGDPLYLLAWMFGVSQSNISAIALRKTWTHIP